MTRSVLFGEIAARAHPKLLIVYHYNRRVPAEQMLADIRRSIAGRVVVAEDLQRFEQSACGLTRKQSAAADAPVKKLSPRLPLFRALRACQAKRRKLKLACPLIHRARNTLRVRRGARQCRL